MKGKYFIVEFSVRHKTPRIFKIDGGTAWFESEADAKLTGDDLCGVLNEDYIICQKP